MACVTLLHEADMIVEGILLLESQRHVKLGCGQVQVLLHAGRYLVGHAMVPTVCRGFTVFWL